MRRPRDYDAELKALDDKTRSLRQRKLTHLGELVMATGADALDAETLAGGLLAMVEANDPARRRAGATAARPSFGDGHGKLHERLSATRLASQRTTAARRRVEARLARTDTRAWVVTRRERTRQLIELGGLVAKAGLVELTGDDRAVIYGALLNVAERLRGEDREHSRALWERRGHRAFEAEAAARDERP